MPEISPELVAVVVGCAIASWTDIKTMKIYNTLTFPLMALGLMLHFGRGDWITGTLGLLLAIAIYYPLWWLGVQKGGDAKLWMAVGALMGPWFVLEASAWYALLYIPAGLAVLAWMGRLDRLMGMVFKRKRRDASPEEEQEDFEPTMLKTAPVISGAVLMALLTDLVQAPG